MSESYTEGHGSRRKGFQWENEEDKRGEWEVNMAEMYYILV